MWGAEGRSAAQRLVALAQFISIWKPEEVLARGRPALVNASKEQVEDTLAVLKVLRPLHTAARVLAGSNRVPLRWRSCGLVVQVPTPEADYIAEKGGVILDATPDLLELKHLCSGGFELVKVVVADGAKVERTVRYCSEASRRRLLPKGEPDWKKVAPLVREALDRAKEAGVQKLLLVTYKPLVERLKKPDSPCAALFDEWKKDGRGLDFAHYGAVRGLNRWETFNGCVSLGDPWQPVEALGDRAAVLGVHPDIYRREAAARELAQVHGRLRAPSRKTAAWLLHIGRLAPSDWSTLNTKVETVRRGPRFDASSLTPAELKTLVEKVGGVIKAAAIAGCDRRTLGRYLRGERLIPEPVARLLSASVTAPVR